MRKIVVFKSLAAVLIVTAFFLTFTISSFAGNDDSFWRKCELDFTDPLKSLSGSVFRFDNTGEGNHYSYALNAETLKGSGYNPTYQFNSFYWQPFRGIDFMGGDSTIKIEFVLQYKDFADAFLQGYNQCRRIETYTAFYVSGQTLYNYTVNLVNGAQTIPLYFEAVKTAAYEPTPVNYWCDFELDPSAYFSISFDVGLSSLSSTSYLYFYVYDFGNIMWLEKPGLEESIKNQQSINNAESMVEDLNKLNQPEPDVDKVFDNIKSDDISAMGGYFTPSNTENNFYILMTSLMVVGVSLGISGYILHGKK